MSAGDGSSCRSAVGVGGERQTGAVFLALRSTSRGVIATELTDEGDLVEETIVADGDLATWVAAREPGRPRWVWNDTARWYPPLLAAGVRVERCVDLRLCHTILRNAVASAGSALATAERDA